MSVLVTNTEEFIKRSRLVHGDKYQYNKSVYTNAKTKLIVTCHVHGDFSQTPSNHLEKRGCPECAKTNRANNRATTTEEFVEQCKKKYGDQFSYEKTIYRRMKEAVSVRCVIHDKDFEITPYSHLRGTGCPECSYESRRTRSLTQDEFIHKANIVHEEAYSYDKVEYTNARTKVTITCQIHGDFDQIPYVHLTGCGCPECANITRRLSYTSNKEEFVVKSEEIHNSFYDYGLVEYINAHTKVTIVCPDHGAFKQSPNSHLSGHGCDVCARRNQESRFSCPKDENIPAELYLVTFLKNGEKYEKIGITTRDVSTRFRNSGIDDLTIIHTSSGTAGDCYKTEQEILNHFSEFRYKLPGEMRSFQGWTETFKFGTLPVEQVIEAMETITSEGKYENNTMEFL